MCVFLGLLPIVSLLSSKIFFLLKKNSRWEIQTRAYVFVLYYRCASPVVVATYPLLCGVCVMWLHARVTQSVDRKLGGMDGGWDMDRDCKHSEICEGVSRAEG